MKVHVVFQRPSDIVLELDSIQQAAFEKWRKAHEFSDSFEWGDDAGWEALTAANDAWDEFIDSVHYELRSASKAEVSDVNEYETGDHP